MQKQLLLAFSLLLCISTITVKATAGDWTDKEKSYSKTYSLSPGDRVSIHNQFGKVEVNTWDKNEIKVDVHISVSADDEGVASEVLDQIHINDSKDGAEVRFHTSIDEAHHGHKDRNIKMNIDYVVYLPASQTLSLENSFGPTTIPDYSGALELTSKFGELQAGKLSNVKSLDVEFNNNKASRISAINGGDLTLKFSKVDIGELSGDIHGDFQFCSELEIKVSKGIKSLNIKNSYTSLRVELESGIPAKFDISTNFGNLNNRSNYNLKDATDDDRKGPVFKRYYSGSSGDGSVDIRIKDEFATIDLT
jgi:hypothetical protein